MSILLLLLLLYSVLQLTASFSPPAIVMPGCPEQCGNVRIPYPFGNGVDCFYNGSYEITCDNSFHPPKPFLHKFNMEVMDINWTGRNPRSASVSNDDNQFIRVGIPHNGTCRSKVSIDFVGSPYSFSSDLNVLVMEGCDKSVVLKNRNRHILTGCATICGNDTVNIATTGCYGIGCCQAELREDLDFYQLDINQEAVSSACDIKVGLMDKRSVKKFAKSTVPTVLFWSAPASVMTTLASYEEKNITCFGDTRCWCMDNYEGNPYVPNGCQGFSLGLGLMILLFGCYFLYRVIKRRNAVRRKSNYFKRNGGLLLQQQICSSEGASQRTKVFPVTELEKATDNFNKNRILGQGGQGTVYKGILKDGGIVAIKKSRIIDKNQLEQFINEVVVLSEINHRNVVKLLGCCLETEVPMLVYEFIQNGTLYQHIHHASEDFHVTWKMRLQMAAESAAAVAYLHSSSSAPIYHRDIKSSNILLDAKFRAKVADFGTSKAIDIEQTHVTTCVMGTYGYLDPEYFQSNQFTEKSDVYSFGVVLVELITGKKPICPTQDGGWISLAVEFLLHMENSRLPDILDARVVEEGKEEEFIAVADLARQCLSMNGKERPTMKEVATMLDEIRSAHVPYSTKPNSMVGKGVMKKSSKHGGSSSSNMFFSDVGPGASSFEVQRFMAHTL
ncbi:hypothetical protein BVRB_4g080890 [Beta vulgaris subsp. vulgaris]|nr:hypothetical protein BVRB_4g080890 [Beta vulgaris subsp. vulgaris]